MLNVSIKIKKDTPISMIITPGTNHPKIYDNMNIKCEIPDAIPVTANKHPLQAENIIMQITKTTNTPYQFKNIKIDLDDNLFLPKISMLNELRRQALEKVEEFAINNIIILCFHYIYDILLGFVYLDLLFLNTSNISHIFLLVLVLLLRLFLFHLF